MNWELCLVNVTLVFVLYELSHAYLYFKSREVKREEKIRIRVLDMGQENAITLKSLFFRNIVVFLSNELDERILRHEEGHMRQFNYIYMFLLVIASLIPLNNYIIIPAGLLGKLLLWHIEREADIYAYIKYNVKFESSMTRPDSRTERLFWWLFDSHPPDWVRKEEKYYEKNENILKLLIYDLKTDLKT